MTQGTLQQAGGVDQKVIADVAARVAQGKSAPGEKAAYVRAMFDSIAPRYDLLNSLLSAGVHDGWRKFAARCAALEAGDAVLDVCTGTGDWTRDLRRTVGPSGTVVGADFSFGMLHNGRGQFQAQDAPPVQADATVLPFLDNSFDAATAAFGIRNVADTRQAFAEMQRVVRPGGRVVCLEFAQVRPGLFRAFYEAYSQWVMPAVGGAVSGRRDAYSYLPESVQHFATRETLAQTMQGAGLTDVRWVDLTFGMVCVHVGTVPFT